jgi:carotenoid cleavage dioxygenase
MNDPGLQGTLAPVDDESTFTEFEIVGEIPKTLRGSYLRNGPNPAFEPKGAYHLWDGDGMIHAMTFEDGNVSYRNRWVQTAALGLEREHGRALFGGMLDHEPPPEELTAKTGRIKNPANTNIVRHAGRYLALWEGGLPTALTTDLYTVGVDDFAGQLRGSMTAHPKIDPVNGEMVFFGYRPIAPFLRLHVVDAAGKLTRSMDIDIPRGIMIHDFMITREHIVFFDSPAIFDFEQHASGGAIIRWAPEFGTRVGVMPREGGPEDMRWIEMDDGYVFHFLNGYTEGQTIHLTGASASWMAVDFEHEKPPEGVDPNTYLHRFTIDLDEGRCKTERIGDVASEFCKVPDAVAGLPNRYGYLASFSTNVCDGAYFDALTKYDLQTGAEIMHPFGTDKVVGEPAFAPDENASAEDDGWIVTWVNDRDGSASEFVILDARNIQDEPVARIKMPRRVPLGFHGNWMAPE